jgi:O-antigen ligase
MTWSPWTAACSDPGPRGHIFETRAKGYNRANVLTPFRPSTLALGALVALAVASPWAFGAVQPTAHQVVSTIALSAGAAALFLATFHGGVPLPALPLAPAAGLLVLVGLQLVPLPPSLHQWVARGSYEVWHPTEPAAAAVLGYGPRPISLDPDTTLRSLAWLFGLLALATLAANEFATRRWTWGAALLIAGNGLVLAAFGIWARSHLGSRLYGRYEVPTIAPFGPFVSKNHFAGYVAMASLLTLGLVIGLTDRREAAGRSWFTGARAAAVVFALVAAAGMALSVLVSGSRGGGAALLAGLLAVAVLAVGSSSPWRRLAAPAVVSVALAGLVLAVLPDEAHQRLRTASGASFRIGVWRDTLRLAAWSPLVGTGLGSFHDALPRAKRVNELQRVEHAENDYLETLAETGTLGLGLAAAGVGLFFARGGRALRRSPPITRGLAIGALAGLTALAVHSALDFNLRVPSNAALAAVLVAAAAAATGIRPRPLSPRASLVGGVVAVLLLVALRALPESPSATARQRVREAALASTPEALGLRLERAEAGLRQALAWRPGQAEAWLQLAAVRAVRGDAPSAAALARYAMSLDPRPDLRAQAEALAAPPAPVISAGSQGLRR